MLPQAWLSPEEADAIRREAESSMPAKRRSEIAECINKELARHTDGDMKFPFNHVSRLAEYRRWAQESDPRPIRDT